MERTMPIRSRICSAATGATAAGLAHVAGQDGIQDRHPNSWSSRNAGTEKPHNWMGFGANFAGAPGFIGACTGWEALLLPQQAPEVCRREQTAMAHLVEDVCY